MKTRPKDTNRMTEKDRHVADRSNSGMVDNSQPAYLSGLKVPPRYPKPQIHRARSWFGDHSRMEFDFEFASQSAFLLLLAIYRLAASADHRLEAVEDRRIPGNQPHSEEQD
jgi:hypothetical protein